MRTNTQKYLDRALILPLLTALNIIVRLLGKILRIDHSLNRPFKVIAVCKFKGLGSIVQATPLLQTLRQHYPTAKIIFISTEANRAFLRQITCIDEIITINDRSFGTLFSSFCPFILQLIGRKIELYFDLEIYSNFSSLVVTLSMAKNRVGFYLRSGQYRLGIYTQMMYYNIQVPIFQTYLQMARLLPIAQVITDLYPLNSPISQLVLADKKPFIFQAHSYIVLNPNASDLRIERRWSAQNFVLLCNLLRERYPTCHLFLIGSKTEADYVSNIAQQIGPTPYLHNIAGQTDIPTLIGLIQHARLLITNDTGPMHLALASRTKTIALFGPCSPAQYGQNNNCFPVYKRVYCSPCVHEFDNPPCKGNNICMQLISVDEVLERVSDIWVMPTCTEANPNFKTNIDDNKPPFSTDNLPQSQYLPCIYSVDNGLGYVLGQVTR